MEIIELATIKHVPILKAGTHHSRNSGAVVISEEELDDTLKGSNELAAFLQAGHVPDIFLDGSTPRKLPSALNLMHDDILDDTIRDRVKGVKHSFTKGANGWIEEDFRDVPTDVAKAIQSHFPLRSVDLIPWKNPDTGKDYKHVIVSTAFLNRYTRPAVDGQSDKLHVEFAGGSEEDPVIVLYSGTEEDKPPQDTGGSKMAVEQKKTAVEEPKTEDNVSELMQAEMSKKDAEIARLKALTQADSQKMTELEAERKAHADAIAELQAQQDEHDVAAYLKEFAMTPHIHNGVRYEVCPGFIELVSPIIQHTGKSAMIELAEGSQPARDVLKSLFSVIVEKAVKNAIVAPVTEMGRMTHTPESTKPGSLDDEIARLQKETPTMPYGAAFQQAAEILGTFEYKEEQ